MGTVIRRCAKCGHHDLRHHWNSIAEAARDDALAAPFTCPRCSWWETELVDIGGLDTDPERPRSAD